MSKIKQIAAQTNSAEFKRLYHDPTVHTHAIAARFGIETSRVSEFARLLGVKTRREVGVMYKPSLLAPKPALDTEAIGKYGCSDKCSQWRRCNDERLWLDGPLPCEAFLADEVGREWDEDSSPSLWVIPLVARVARMNVEAG